MEKRYYLDSCVWLNLFQKEGDATKGIPYWQIALNFIENIKNNKNKVYVSTIVLKELYYILGNKFHNVKTYFEQTDFIVIIKTKNEDYNLARKFENEDDFQISFYDYLHVAIARRIDCVFVTRDKDLLDFARNKINANLPEKLIG